MKRLNCTELSHSSSPLKFGLATGATIKRANIPTARLVALRQFQVEGVGYEAREGP